MRYAFIFLVFFALPALSHSATIYVPDDYGTIQMAIMATTSGDTIIVKPDTYKENIDFLGKAVTVRSEQGQEVTFIDGMQGTAVQCMNNEGPVSVLYGFTITNSGVGMSTYMSSPTVKKCKFHQNAGRGMTIEWQSSPTLKECLFSENSSGGMSIKTVSHPELTDCEFLKNTASQGGGVYIEDNCHPLLTRCRFIENSVYGVGGGMYVYKDSDPTLTDCLFSGNAASPGSGGGMANYLRCEPRLTNCLFFNNTALESGGGMLNNMSCVPKLNCCTFSKNVVNAGEGGGMYNYSSYPEATNCIFWNDYPKEIYDNKSYPVIMYSCIQGGYSGTGNIAQDPLFHDPSNNNFHLNQDPCQPGVTNPCVDKGDPGSSMIDGSTRTDGVQDTVIVDMGYHYPVPKLWKVPSDFSTIQAAIDAATSGDTIIVYSDTYEENIDFLGKDILVSSFAGPAFTTIDGMQTGSVVTFENGESPTLKGFTITNGKAPNGGGVYCEYGSSPTILTNIITGNTADSPEGGNGGGIYVGSVSSPVIVNNIIVENTTAGGVDKRGGGIFCLSSSSPTIHNNTLSDNFAPLGGGIYCEASSNTIIRNTIVYGNTGTEIHGFPMVTYSDVEGVYSGEGNIDQFPCFADPLNGDYHLTQSSPCINRGTNEVFGYHDMDMDPRPFMGTMDMGADEFTGIHHLEADVFFLNSNVGGTVEFTLNTDPSNWGRYYLILASVHGTAPGFWLPKNLAIMPLNWDGITNYVFANINTYTFDQFFGTIDMLGQAFARFNATQLIQGWYDITMSFAFTMNKPFDFASNPINVEIDN